MVCIDDRPYVHFTPTSGSWLNLVECWFAIIERQAIHRGSFGSVPDLNAAIRRFINGWNERSTPFTYRCRVIRSNEVSLLLGREPPSLCLR